MAAAAALWSSGCGDQPAVGCGADSGAAAAAPARLQCLLGGRGRASTSRRRFCRGPALAAKAPSGGAATAAPESAEHPTSPCTARDRVASSSVALVCDALYLALSFRTSGQSVVPLVTRCRADLTAWPTRAPAAVAGNGDSLRSRRRDPGDWIEPLALYGGESTGTPTAPPHAACGIGESEANRRFWRPQWSASSYGEVGGAHPGPERHDGRTASTTREREVDRHTHHGSTRACQQDGRDPLM